MAEPLRQKSPFSLAEIMTLYGLSLMVCGALAFQASGLQRKALSSVFVGNGGAVACFLLAAGMRDPGAQKGTRAHKLLMVCVHLGFVLPLVMAGAVGWRLAKAWDVEEKQYLRPYLSYMVVTSLATALAIYRKKPARPATADAAVAAAKKSDGDAKGAKGAKKAAADAPTSSVRRRARRAAAE